MRRSIAIYLVALLIASALIAPAANAAVPDTNDCAETLVATPEGDHAISRGDDIVKEPSIDEPTATLPDSARGKGSSKFRATVPVYFHVVSHGAVGNVTDAQIAEQIEVMNLAFGGVYGGVKTGFKFELAGITRTVNADWYNAGPGTSAEREMKKALSRGAPYALNYYSATAGPYLGWAYFPGLPNGRMFLDGIVVDWESMPGTSTRYAGRYDLGLTAVHEVGHWVGLHHVFNGGCNRWGDYVDDTPKQLTATRACPTGQDSCPEPGLDSIHNYMDYSYDSCYFEFTSGQAARAQDHWLEFRAP